MHRLILLESHEVVKKLRNRSRSSQLQEDYLKIILSLTSVEVINKILDLVVVACLARVLGIKNFGVLG